MTDVVDGEDVGVIERRGGPASCFEAAEAAWVGDEFVPTAP